MQRESDRLQSLDAELPGEPVATPDRAVETAAADRQRELIKPRGALGRLEDIAVWMAARRKQVVPPPVSASVLVFAADHGVAARGVSAFPASVTAQMVAAIAAGRAAVNVFARATGAALRVIDVGVNADLENISGVVHAKVRRGTGDLSTEPAMTVEDARHALEVGREHAARAIGEGATLLIAGEVGIANTTASAALLCVLMKEEPERIVGRGTGIDEASLRHKIEIVSRAVRRVLCGPARDPVAVLAEVGGLEIAAMAGCYLEAARRGTPILLDGFVSAAGAAVATSIAPRCREWYLAGHASAETGHRLALEWLGLKAILDLGLRLGEGTGALLALPIVQAAIAMHAQMPTFEEAGVSRRQ